MNFYKFLGITLDRRFFILKCSYHNLSLLFRQEKDY
jgi:hypothetical protein